MPEVVKEKALGTLMKQIVIIGTPPRIQLGRHAKLQDSHKNRNQAVRR